MERVFLFTLFVFYFDKNARKSTAISTLQLRSTSLNKTLTIKIHAVRKIFEFSSVIEINMQYKAENKKLRVLYCYIIKFVTGLGGECADGAQQVSKERSDRVPIYVSRLLTTAFTFLIFRSSNHWEQNPS